MRSECQIPKFAAAVPAPAGLETVAVEEAQPEPWPTSAADQIQAIQNLVTHVPYTVEEACAHVPGTPRELFERHPGDAGADGCGSGGGWAADALAKDP
jgi:hypothetical protein